MVSDAPTVIAAKRDGRRLDDAQIDWMIDAHLRGEVADAQMSALLMAIYLRGMDRGETGRWTRAMLASGPRLDFTGLRRDGRALPTVDKHSTGGVGDKITLTLLPVVAACGAAVPQAAGRGLGHTGGTLDKLEAIPGFSAELPAARIAEQLVTVGAAVFGAGELAPADRALYALRDVTATVESLPLIASSIMSKKLAEGAASLVLDVKTGRGAFLTDPAESRELASTMVALAADHGVDCVALLTDMDVPLGRSAGNAVEVAEALDVLAGGGPPDVVALTLALAREMLTLAGVDGRDPAATLADGSAMDRFRALITAQGGDVDAPLPFGAATETVCSPHGGVMGDVDARAIGDAAWRLGGGRTRPGEAVQQGAGVLLHRRPGEPVAAGQPLFTLHTDTPDRLPAALAALEGAWSVGDDAPPSRPLLQGRLTVGEETP